MCGFSVLPWSGPPKCAGSPRDSRSRPSLWVEVGHQGGAACTGLLWAGGGARRAWIGAGLTVAACVRVGGAAQGTPVPSSQGPAQTPPHTQTSCMFA